MKVKNWVPISNIISYQNVPDEDLTVLSKSSLPENVIKGIYYYYQRSVFAQFFPWDNISLVLKQVWDKYLSYLKQITGKQITKDNFINFSWKTIQQIAKEIKVIKNLSSYSLLPFITVKTAQELWSVLNNYWIWVPNLWKEKEVELANSKVFLRELVKDKYMVKWEILNVKETDFLKKLENILAKNEEKWVKTIVRIPRSASWLGIRFLVRNNPSSEIEIDPKELVNILNHIKVNKILVENALPKNSFSSPNVVGYIHSNWKIDIFWVTDQLLINNIHQGNIYNPENEDIYKNLANISKKILKQYYKKLWVIGYFWVDFLLLESSKIKNKQNYFSDNFEWKFNVNQKEYLAPVVEINFRINGGMPLSWLRNLNWFDIKNKYTGIINTLELKEDVDVVSTLSKNNLLFDNGKDNSEWVVIVTILPWKLQYIIIANNKENFSKIDKKIRNLLSK